MLTSFAQKWKSMPRIARFYITVGLIVTIFLIVILYFPKNDSLVEVNDKHEFKPTVQHKSEELTDIKPNEQIIKPIVHQNVDNSYKNKESLESKDQMTGDESIQAIDSLSLNVFKQSVQRHQTNEQKAIVSALRHSWDAYKKYAWGADHLKPITKSKHNWFSVGLTILDSLDTLIMMGLEEGLPII